MNLSITELNENEWETQRCLTNYRVTWQITCNSKSYFHCIRSSYSSLFVLDIAFSDSFAKHFAFQVTREMKTKNTKNKCRIQNYNEKQQNSFLYSSHRIRLTPTHFMRMLSHVFRLYWCGKRKRSDRKTCFFPNRKRGVASILLRNSVIFQSIFSAFFHFPQKHNFLFHFFLSIFQFHFINFHRRDNRLNVTMATSICLNFFSSSLKQSEITYR